MPTRTYSGGIESRDASKKYDLPPSKAESPHRISLPRLQKSLWIEDANIWTKEPLVVKDGPLVIFSNNEVVCTETFGPDIGKNH